MSLLDSQILDWVRTAKLSRIDKVDLLSRSLQCIDGHQHVDVGVKVKREMVDDIEEYLQQLSKEIEKYGEHAIDEREEHDEGPKKGFEFGDDEGQAADHLDASGHNDSQKKGRSARRKTVSSEVINLEEIDEYTPPEHEKDADAAKWLFDSLSQYYLFEHLDSSEVKTIVNAMKNDNKEAGEVIFSAGDEGDTLYLIQEGVASAHTEDEATTTMGPGSYIGDEELMYSAEAQYTLEADEDLILWSLDRQTYRYIVTKASIKKRALYEDFLMNIDFLEALTSFERLQVADALKTTEYADGEKIISFGEEGTHFHIIIEGSVRVLGRDEAGEETEVCNFSEGDCIGELEFINNHKTCADVIAEGEVKTAKMGRRHFEKVMGPVEDFLKDRYKVFIL